ncbi:MAG: SlyX family protein [Nitratireductor sp.]|nr:SlyX family protein [Nitratireductor sp.]
MSDERLRKLEELVAHQALTIEEMSAEMAAQGETLRALQTRLDVLVRRFVALEESAAPHVPVTRPPHW